MKPGDKVRFMKSSGEGVIRKINSDNKTIEVEIEDGFVIPVLRNEIVVVAVEEKEIFGKHRDTQTFSQVNEVKHINTKGIYLSFTPFNQSIFTLEVLNCSDAEILVSVFESEKTGEIGIAREILQPGKAFKFGERKTDQFDHWNALIFQILLFSYSRISLPAPIVRKISFNPATFFKHKKSHPLSGKEAFVFELEADKKPLAIPTMQESLNQGKREEARQFEIPNDEIDLHIEKLTPDFKKMSADQILPFQMEKFRNNLENAIASGKSEITFIHGVGNGALKNQIHKYLSGHKEIDFFKDAQKEKFGYGATFVKFK